MLLGWFGYTQQDFANKQKVRLEGGTLESRPLFPPSSTSTQNSLNPSIILIRLSCLTASFPACFFSFHSVLICEHFSVINPQLGLCVQSIISPSPLETNLHISSSFPLKNSLVVTPALVCLSLNVPVPLCFFQLALLFRLFLSAA